MLGRLSVITPPATLPVNSYLVRQHTRIDSANDDELLAIYIASATELAETFLNRALITRTLQWSLADSYPPNSWPMVPVNPGIFILPLGLEWSWTHLMQRDIELPRSPVQSVTSVKYTLWPTSVASDIGPQAVTLDVDYSLDLSCDPGRVRIMSDVPWVNRASLSIEYVAGYGSTPAAIPAPILHAILLTVAASYEARGDTDQPVLPAAAEALLWQYRMATFW